MSLSQSGCSLTTWHTTCPLWQRCRILTIYTRGLSAGVSLLRLITQPPTSLALRAYHLHPPLSVHGIALSVVKPRTNSSAPHYVFGCLMLVVYHVRCCVAILEYLHPLQTHHRIDRYSLTKEEQPSRGLGQPSSSLRRRAE